MAKTPRTAKKVVRKVVRKKVARKKARRKKKGLKKDAAGRKVPIETPALGVGLIEQTSILRNIAATDYISDPDGHAVRWHYERPDRFYPKVVSWRTFENWAIKDRWTPRRGEFWAEIENRVRVHMGDENYRYRVKHMDKLKTLSETIELLLMPLKGKDGKVQFDEETGIPKFPVELPKLDKLVKVWLDITERTLVLRGETTKRTETVNEGNVSAHIEAPNIRPKLSQEDVRAMSRQLLRERVPELAEVEALDDSGIHDGGVPVLKPEGGDGEAGQGGKPSGG